MRARAAVAILSLAVLPLVEAAQNFPEKPVRIITTFPSGSGPDAAMRLIAARLSKAWGQQVVVDNRPGGNGFIGLGMARTAVPDGYTLAQASSAQITTHRLIYRSLPYDPVKDFEAIVPLFRNHFFVVVPASSSWKGVGDLIAAAKAKPNGFTYGSEFIGSPGHLGAASLEAATGTQMTHVPYKETGQLFAAVGRGDVQWAFGTAGTAGAAVQSGSARLLALAAPRRLSSYPDVPTVSESGGPAGFEVAAWTGLLAPRGTPRAIVEQVNRDVARAVAEPEVRERFAAFGYEAWDITPAQTSAAMAAELRGHAGTIKRLNLQLD